MDCINFRLEGEHLCDLSWSAKTYACSFCQREFRSAQALGGHMNVHRRDRARLRLLPPSCLNPNPNPNPNSYFSCSSSSSSSSSSSLSSAKCLPLHNHYSSSHRHSLLSPDSLQTTTCKVPTATAPSSSSSACADGNKKLMMILDPPPPHHQNHVPLIHNPNPKKGMMRSVLGSTLVEAGDLMKGFVQEEDDEFIVNMKKDDENINRVDLDLDLDLDMGFLTKDPCKLDEEVDLELRLGHL